MAQAYALAQLQASEGDAERALSLFTATGTAVLVQGKLTTTPEGTKQVCTMLLHLAMSWLSFGPLWRHRPLSWSLLRPVLLAHGVHITV